MIKKIKEKMNINLKKYKIKHCENFIDKTIGLMFSKKKKNKICILYNNGSKLSLHMFFVFYSIDVYFLNNKKEIIGIKKNFKPFTIIKPNFGWYYAVETIKGLLNAKIGDKLIF